MQQQTVQGGEAAKRQQRVYELARELGVVPKDVVTKCQALGMDVRNHMSLLDDEDAARLRRAYDKDRQKNLVEERLSATVIRRRTKGGAEIAHAPVTRTAAEPTPARAPADDEETAPPREIETDFEDKTPLPPPPRRTPAETVETPVEAVEAEEEPKTTPIQRPSMPTPVAEPAEAPAASAAPASAPAAPAKSGWVRPQVGDRIALPGRPLSAPSVSMHGDGDGRVLDVPLPRIQITEVDDRRGRGGMANRGGAPGGRAMPGGRFGARQPIGKKRVQAGKKTKQTLITTPAEHKRVIKMQDTIAVSELAREMGVKANDVLKKLWGMGMMGVTINQSIDLDTASLIATDFGYQVENVAFQEAAVLQEATDAPEDLELRAPVVTIMGHVDHGKTSLLDAIRSAHVAEGEAGGITQHIGAYKVDAPSGEVVFLDTPGHEAFTAMRARGAQVTDIVVLVVAADDGPMPQTIEAINHAKDAKVPIVVAVNKVDKPQAQPDRIRQQLSEHGLVPEAWGGETIYVDVSARTRQGVDQLLEMLALQAEVLELRANPKKPAKGTVVEARLDRARGPISTVLVQEGTLRLGDIVVAGEHTGKVRAMLDDKGEALQEAPPSTPVELLGIDGVPDAGEVMNVVTDEKVARQLIEHRREARRKKELGQTARVSLENILEKIQEGSAKELKIVLKTDVQGSAEALRDALGKLSTDTVRVNVISAAVGGITESDVNLAKAGGAIILGFHVRPAGKASSLAEQEHVDIKLYDIIYEALDDVKKAMAGLLAPVVKERSLGKAEVREIFNIPKIGTVAGCSVSEGKIVRSAQIRLVRDHVQIHQGKLGSLKRFKDDVREVVQGYECGLTLESYNDIHVGDVIECYELVQEAATL